MSAHSYRDHATRSYTVAVYSPVTKQRLHIVKTLLTKKQADVLCKKLNATKLDLGRN